MKTPPTPVHRRRPGRTSGLGAAPGRIGALILPLVLATLPVPATAAQKHEAASTGAALWAVADETTQQAYDQPARALAALDRQLRTKEAGSADWRVLLRSRGMVAAVGNRAAEAESAARALATARPLGQADATVVRMLLADAQGASPAAIDLAEQAVAAYAQACPPRPDECEHRGLWTAQQTLARHLLYQGKAARSRTVALAAGETARQAQDSGRQAQSLALAAEASAVVGELDQALPLRAQAQRLTRLDGTPRLAARMALFESSWHAQRGDTALARRVVEQALPLALQAGSPRLHAKLLINLSDLHLRARQSAQALAAAEAALPVLRAGGDQRGVLTALSNAALARIGLGQLATARSILDEVLAVQRGAAAAADQATVLREFADAFAAAGDYGSALALYHRERELASAMMASNREAMLAELRERFDREAQQRKLEQLKRDNALVSAQIDNRAAMRKVWLGLAVLLGLAVALVGLLYHRVRNINRHLAHNHAFLRAQSQRDPLTGLANRRALHDLTLQQDVQQAFGGALLLVDIDHFKHINDGHGHVAGDLVLVEVAQRLAGVARRDDLVVRWGGEEFLIYRRVASAPQADALAADVLQALGGEPVALPGGALRVTASVGYGVFPLPPAHLPLSLERAINFADMALYTAKNQGRNRAVGISAVLASDAATLAGTEADFDQAWQEGRVTLQRIAGPGQPLAPGAATQLAPA
jgi:diguanylate cyclase (GGDEF)-like protein